MNAKPYLQRIELKRNTIECCARFSKDSTVRLGRF